MENFLVLLLLLIFYQCLSRDLPSYFPKCHIDDPNLNECILNATRILKPYVQNGIDEIKLPSFNPLYFARFDVLQENDVVKINASVLNAKIRGFGDYYFSEISYNNITLKLQGKLNLPRLYFSCDYITSSKLIYFPVVGNGTVEAEFGLTNSSFEVTGKLEKYNNVTYYNPTSTKILMKVNGFSVQADGLFSNNQELGHLTNELINLNGQAIVDAGTPVLEQITQTMLMRFMRTLTRLVPYDKIFPKSNNF